ncbi:CaiB/BaiF CoA transferase family protein [Chloroflexota bacterium]
MEMALSGVKVFDFSWVIAGPMTTKILADYGATVIRVETSYTYDPQRVSAPYKDSQTGVNRSGYFGFFNSNKYGITLNLKHPRGLEVAKRLIKWADVVAESFAPGKMEALGLGYEDIKKVKPDIIMFRDSNLGQTGIYATQPGYGTLLMGYTGFTNLTGWPDRTPAQPYGAYTDVLAPVLGAAAIIAALNYRDKTGKGQCIDISQHEVGVQALAPVILDYSVNKRNQIRKGNASDYAAPHAAYRCRGDDRHCVIAVLTDEQWEAFCGVIGNPAWTKEPRFATLLGRKENEDEMNRLVEEWTINFTPGEVMERMQKAGVPSGIVQSSPDLLEDPQLKSRNALWMMNHQELGEFPCLGQPFKLSKTPSGLRMPANLFGEHNEYVYREILGMPQDEFDELLVTGCFE